MTTYCQVQNGSVVNRALFDGAIPADWPDRDSWIESEVAQIGWTYADNEFAPPPAEPPAPPPVPMVISPRQARLALLSLGLLDQVNDVVAGGPVEMRIAWEFSTEVRRDDPGVIALAKQLGIADRLPELFTMAAAL